MTERTPEEWFHTLATNYVEAQIYFHLNQVGVVEKLRERPSTPATLANELELDLRILEILLAYAANVGDLIELVEAGRYGITRFGHEILARYSKSNGEQRRLNLFDVRVGAWGIVWQKLGAMLTKSEVYGRDFRRAGDYAADGLFKLAVPLASVLHDIALEAQVDTLVEIGPTSGLLALLFEAGAARRCVGIDIRQDSLRLAARLAEERNVRDIEWVHGDLFEPGAWLRDITGGHRSLFFSCHFHEFLSQGVDRVAASIRKLATAHGSQGVTILEQPRLELWQRDSISKPQWLYSQSNVLIHHLIRNARIQTVDEWRALLKAAGCTQVHTLPTNAFGFNALWGRSC